MARLKIIDRFKGVGTVSTAKISEASDTIPDAQNIETCLTCTYPDCIGNKCDRIKRYGKRRRVEG